MRRLGLAVVVLLVMTGLLSGGGGGAVAAELKVLSTVALRDSWHELQGTFEARGHRLVIVLGTSGDMARRVAEGEVADVVVTTQAAVTSLGASGKVVGASARVVARSDMGIGVLRGAPRPDISTPEALRQTLLAARAVAYGDPAGGSASGIYFAKVLERLGIAAQVNARAKLGRGVPNGEAVVRGEADLAVQQIPELLAVTGIEIAGPLPGDLRNVTTFSGAVLTASPAPEAARALLDFLVAPETVALLRAKGFEK